MYKSLSKLKLMKVIQREFEIRFKGITIPEMEIQFESNGNIISLFACRDESSDDFIEILRKHKLLLRTDQFFIFINTDLLMKLFFSEYRVNYNSVEFFDVNEFGLTSFIFSVVIDEQETEFTISAGNIMHAYIKALMEPNWGQHVNQMDPRNIVAVH